MFASQMPAQIRAEEEISEEPELIEETVQEEKNIEESENAPDEGIELEDDTEEENLGVNGPVF